MKPIEILSTGTKSSHNAGPLKVTTQILKDVLETFSGAVRFVAGHPPAEREQEYELAQATGLAVRNGKLAVTGYQGFPPAVRAIVNSGELNRVSCKLRSPDHPKNKTGKWKLLHIGLFGRNPTADQAIGDVMLSAGDVLLSADAALPEFPQNENGEDSGSQGGSDEPPTPDELPTDSPIGETPDTPPSEETPTVTTATPPTPAPTDAELAAQRAQLEAERQDFELRRAVFNRAQAIDPWLERQIAAGKVLPAEKQSVQAVFSQVPEQDIELSQGDGSLQKLGLTAALKSFIEGLPQRVDYGEKTPPDPQLQAGEPADPNEQVRKVTEAKFAAARRRA